MTNCHSPVRVFITGDEGLLGYHARAAILAENCARTYNQQPLAYEIIGSTRIERANQGKLVELLRDADLVLHLAGINRASPEQVEFGNTSIASCLVDALTEAGSGPHLVYANSTHAEGDSPYGRGKQAAHRLFEEWAERNSARYTNAILPHIFGEKARPHYNNVTATLCSQVVKGEAPTINDGAWVELVHAGKVVDWMLAAYADPAVGDCRIAGKKIIVQDLYETIHSYNEMYAGNQYPDLSDEFAVALFNTYRDFSFPGLYPRLLDLHEDERGILFEAVKGGGGGQTFLSWTSPGVERGNHFHRQKVERFLVVSGTAEIRIRALFSNEVKSFFVDGATPAFVDMPTLHTHSIVNTGTEPLLTLFWAHEVFDPDAPDTYAHSV